MWNRIDLKQNAKEILRKCYWPAFAVSLVLMIVNGSSNGSGQSTYNSSEIGMQWLPLIILVGLVVVSVGILIKIFVGYSLEVGGRKFYIEAIKDNVNAGYLAYGFKSSGFLNIVKVMFVRSMVTFAWALLLIVPGIIKYYAYRMVPYILAENPHMEYKRALELSVQMTQGEKMNIFVLDLSFIGWYLLGALLMGIGILFVQPYVDMTHALLYKELRASVILSGESTESEFENEDDDYDQI